MQKVFITYRLAPGVSMDAYKEWSRTVDQRITPFQDSIDGFVPWQILGGEPDDTGVDIIEEITIEDWDAYQKMQKESSEMAVVLEGFERLKEFGELLKGSYGSLRRGQAEIELVDYFSADQEPVRIELDPRLAPEENIERYFKRYGKAKRAGPSIEARKGEVEARVKKLAQLGEEVLEAADEEVLDRVSQEATGYLRAKKRSRKEDSIQKAQKKDSFAQARSRK